MSVALTVRVVNEANDRIAEETTRLETTSFAPTRSADCRFPVPVDRLPAGEYLLTIEGAAGTLTVHREVRFHVQ
jgi:hypothetical protein